ncbi:MAG: hypothetical protein ABEH47_06820 [Haloferacaceae archaeon]
MSEEHNRIVSETATDFRVNEPSVLLSAYSLDGQPTVVLSADERAPDDDEALTDLLGAVVTALADRRGASKEAMAHRLRERAERLQAEAEAEQRRYEVEEERGDVLHLPDDG